MKPVLNHHFTQVGPRPANDFRAMDTTRFREYISPTQHIYLPLMKSIVKMCIISFSH